MIKRWRLTHSLVDCLEMLKRSGRLDVLWLTSGRWVVQLSALFVFFISIKYIEIEEYGAYSILVGFIVLNEIVSRECIENYIVSNNAIDIKRLSIGCHFFGVFSGVLCLLLATLFVDSISYFSLDFLLVFLIVFCQWAGSCARGVLLKNLKSREIAITNSISSLLASIVSITLVIQGYGILALLIQQLLIWFVSALVFRYFSKQFSLSSNAHSDAMLYLHLKSSLPSSLVHVLSNRMDLLVISIVLGNHDVGVYAFVKRIFQIIQDLLSGGLERYLLSKQSNSAASHRASNSILYRSVLSFVMFPVCFGVAILAPFIFPVIFGDKWQESYELFNIMALGSVFSSLVSLERSNYYSSGIVKALLGIRVFDLLLVSFLLYAFLDGGLTSITLSYTLRFIILFMLSFFIYMSVVRIKKQYVSDLLRSTYPILVGLFALYVVGFSYGVALLGEYLRLIVYLIALTCIYLSLNLAINRYIIFKDGRYKVDV
jgi:O-antigen/teichoic acid export membrane protein